MSSFEDDVRRGGSVAIASASRFLMRDDLFHATLREIAADLDSNHIDYAVVGGMAPVAHGFCIPSAPRPSSPISHRRPVMTRISQFLIGATLLTAEIAYAQPYIV